MQGIEIPARYQRAGRSPESLEKDFAESRESDGSREKVMNPVSNRAKSPHRNGTEILVVHYQGKQMRATVTQDFDGVGWDDASTAEGCEVQINMIVSRSVVAKEVKEMLDDSKHGNNMLFICRTFNIKRDVMTALGFVAGAMTA